MKLTDKLDEYRALLDRKDDLAQQTKDNNAEIDKCKKELVDLMVEEEVTNVTKDGYSYTLALKTYYSKKSEAELAAAGIDFFDVLRSEGMGDLIKETVNTRTLQSACANIVEEQEELPEALAECINSYEAYDITKRKSRKSA
ncbi:MAG: hypothetical protein IJ168_08215 [Eubacterium sp.]|nr:hypothetical protein [Eubacterium sp.]